ncbi:MAG: hypothetical protein HDR10_02250 [Lachnospiraceae bacterium]|nr:hypothetical protein [Lachnospiraceae bacterium]
MATDEEYLDNLLKSITENETQSQTVNNVMQSEEDLIPEAVVLPEEDLLSEAVVLPEEDLLSADSMLSEGELSFGDDLLSGEDMLSEKNISFESEMPSMNAASSSDDEAWMEDLKDLMENNTIPEDDSDLDASINNMSDVDIADLLSGMGDIDEELEEIGGLLKHADGDESVDMDVLALLEGISGSGESEESTDLFANLLDDSAFEETGNEENPGEQTEEEDLSPKAKKKRAKKNKSEKKRWFFGKKKRAKDAAGEGETPTELVVPFEVAEAVIEQEKGESDAAPFEEADMQDNIGEGLMEDMNPESEVGIGSEEAVSDTEAAENGDKEQKPKEKKQGFFARLFNALTQEEEEVENISEENKEILNELEEEDKKNSKKKEKKGKKGDKKKKGKEAKGEEGEAAENAKADGKKKKPKKEKKPKEEKPKEKTVKVLSKRKLLVLIAFCATIIGSIILLSFFLPEYADKKSARNAYNTGDYESVYTLLYDQNLNSSDLLIFNRAETIRKMERRVESYENNLTLGRELEALDSLLKGVECYRTLTEADEFGVRQEVDAIYQQICSILDGDYGITAEEAIEINTYDSENYTKRLYSAVYGTSFTRQGEESVPEEQTEPSQPQDVLADEEEIISY